jgi:hypothetical protein
MRHRTLVIAGALAVALVCDGRARALPDRTLVAHDFSTSAQGWLIAGDTGMVEPTFEPRGGHTGGFISNDDEAVGETWYFRAPDSVVTQLPAAEHGLLTYRLRQSDTDAGFPDDDVVIIGPAGRISYRFEHSPGTDWTAFSVRLSADAGWHWNWSHRATQEQIKRVLTQPTRLEIRGEYRTGPDVGGLDNVALIACD